MFYTKGMRFVFTPYAVKGHACQCWSVRRICEHETEVAVAQKNTVFNKLFKTFLYFDPH